jgi:hypothetical protein
VSASTLTTTSMLFNRGEHPMMVFDREGNFLRSWGEGQYPRAYGVHMAPDDTMFLTDDGGHFVRKVTLDGKVLLELGVPGKPAPYMSGEPFHRCTHTALSPRGDIYVSDGYGNSRVHKYTPSGKLLMSWGEPGTGEGEFRWRDYQDSRRDSSQSEDALIGRALHQHKLHFSEVYGLRRDQSGRIFLKNDRLVFHEGE